MDERIITVTGSFPRRDEPEESEDPDTNYVHLRHCRDLSGNAQKTYLNQFEADEFDLATSQFKLPGDLPVGRPPLYNPLAVEAGGWFTTPFGDLPRRRYEPDHPERRRFMVIGQTGDVEITFLTQDEGEQHMQTARIYFLNTPDYAVNVGRYGGQWYPMQMAFPHHIFGPWEERVRSLEPVPDHQLPPIQNLRIGSSPLPPNQPTARAENGMNIPMRPAAEYGHAVRFLFRSSAGMVVQTFLSSEERAAFRYAELHAELSFESANDFEMLANPRDPLMLPGAGAYREAPVRLEAYVPAADREYSYLLDAPFGDQDRDQDQGNSDFNDEDLSDAEDLTYAEYSHLPDAQDPYAEYSHLPDAPPIDEDDENSPDSDGESPEADDEASSESSDDSSSEPEMNTPRGNPFAAAAHAQQLPRPQYAPVQPILPGPRRSRRLQPAPGQPEQQRSPTPVAPGRQPAAQRPRRPVAPRRQPTPQDSPTPAGPRRPRAQRRAPRPEAPPRPVPDNPPMLPGGMPRRPSPPRIQGTGIFAGGGYQLYAPGTAPGANFDRDFPKLDRTGNVIEGPQPDLNAGRPKRNREVSERGKEAEEEKKRQDSKRRRFY